VGKPILHQLTVGASPGDAITDYALLLRRWLREDGFHSEIFAEGIDLTLADEVQPYLKYRPSRPREIVILHHSIGSAVVDYLLLMDVRVLLIYHNVTPVKFLQGVDPVLALQLEKGRSQLVDLAAKTVLGLGDSRYNELELQRAGLFPTGVVPIPLEESRYQTEPNQQLLQCYQDGGPNLLFVGRLVPNKRQEDLIKLLYHYRRIVPSARLFLVGSPWIPAYADWLRDLANELGLGEAVVFAGHVSQRDLVTYYRLADVYVSMSEHEGLGRPLIESMYFDVPVIAYAAAAVPETMGRSGVLFREKNYEALAELVGILLRNNDLRLGVIACQQERLQSFMEPQVRSEWNSTLKKVNLL
jgi:glycosyltransferase involved in cell wall biosynthesis